MARKLNTRNSTGYRGVSWSRQARGYASRIQVRCRKFFLGYFKSKKAAALAFDHAARRHRRLAWLNFPER